MDLPDPPSVVARAIDIGRMHRVFRVLSTAALALLLSTSAFGQLASQTGLIGTVTDSNGGVLPGATVTAVNVGTQTKLAGVTNEAGVYQFNAVPLGSYEITITLQGFQTFKATNIVVGGNQVVRQDAVLSVGDLNETITVEASNTTIQTDRAAVSQTVEARAVTDLPSSGRNVWQMAATTPGVLRGQTTDIGLSFRGAGQREIQNSLTMDGINASSNLLAMTSMRPMADAVTEVTVQTGSTSAEYGSYLGVAINVVTKAGTNSLHGALFEYFQDDSLESRGYFDNLNLPEPPKRSNQFGVQMDGPVVIPGLYNGTNKTFFMGAYEGLRSERTTSPFGSVPTEKMRRGDFSEVSTQIVNPYTKVPYPGNQIPLGDISDEAVRLLQYYPAAQPAGPGQQLPGAGADREQHRPDSGARRPEHRQQGAGVRPLQLGGRLRRLREPSARRTGLYQPRVNKNTLGSWQQTLSPTLLNDFRIGYHRTRLRLAEQPHDRGRALGGCRPRHPRLRRRRQVRQPGHPHHRGHRLLRARQRRHQLVPVRHDLPDVERAVVEQGDAQHPHRLRPAQDGDRPPRRQRARAARFSFNGQMTGHAVADFLTGVPITRHGRRSTRCRGTSASGATASSSTTSGRRRAT